MLALVVLALVVCPGLQELEQYKGGVGHRAAIHELEHRPMWQLPPAKDLEPVPVLAREARVAQAEGGGPKRWYAGRRNV